MTTEDTVVELNILIKTCKDGELSYRTAATDVRNTKLETVFTEYAKQRGQFARKLQAEVERRPSPEKPAGNSLCGEPDFGSTNFQPPFR